MWSLANMMLFYYDVDDFNKLKVYLKQADYDVHIHSAIEFNQRSDYVTLK